MSQSCWNGAWERPYRPSWGAHRGFEHASSWRAGGGGGGEGGGKKGVVVVVVVGQRSHSHVVCGYHVHEAEVR